MDEIGIKAEVLTRIRREFKGRDLPTITSEFSLNGTGIRADLVILGDSFHGIEIKSAADTLKRLPNQMLGYARYFDRTTLVVATKHLRALREIALQGVEVWSREVVGDWQCRRVGIASEVPGNTLLGLLTAEEERRALRSIMNDDGSVANADARMAFKDAFNRRYKPTSDVFWNSVRGRTIRRDDVPLLSRYLPERERFREAQAAHDFEWSNWAARIAALASTPSDNQPTQSSSVSCNPAGSP